MLNIKYAFYGLSRKLRFTILTIIQLAFCIFLIYMGLYFRSFMKSETEKVTKIFDGKVVYKMQVSDARRIFTDELDIKSLEELNTYVKEAKDFIHVSFSNDAVFIPEFNGIEKFRKALITNNYEGNNLVLVNAFKIDEKFFENFKFRIDEGEDFNKRDFSLGYDKIIPVVLGSSYKNIYKLNDIIKAVNTDDKVMQLRVIGFLENDNYFISNSLMPDKLINLNNYIIFPQQSFQSQIDSVAKKGNIEEVDKYYRVNLYNNIFNSIIIFKSNDAMKINKSLDEIKEKGKVVKVPDIEINSLDKFIIIFKQDYENQQMIANTLAIVMCFFTSISILISTISSIIKRTKEFGIHIMLGGTLEDIAKRIVGEIIILITIPYIVVIMSLGTKIGSILGFKFQPIIVLQLTIILLILIIFVTIIPVIKILRSDINNLIKGGN